MTAEGAGPARAGVPHRRRDPARKARILAAAAELAAERGFHGVAMAEIAARAGIVGSGIYRHFPGKEAILVALLDRVMDRLATGLRGVLDRELDASSTITLLVRDHIDVAVSDRAVLAVYHREAGYLPETDRRRLRRAQRRYLAEWVAALAPLRPDLEPAELRVVVLGAIGAIQSTLFFRTGLDRRTLSVLLEDIAHACLGVEPAAPDATG